MNILIVILSVLVALEFFFIMYLETFATTSSFDMLKLSACQKMIFKMKR